MIEYFGIALAFIFPISFIIAFISVYRDFKKDLKKTDKGEKNHDEE